MNEKKNDRPFVSFNGTFFSCHISANNSSQEICSLRCFISFFLQELVPLFFKKKKKKNLFNRFRKIFR